MKGSLTQFECLQVSTAGTFARCALKASDLNNGFPTLGCNVLEGIEELVERQITHFATPQGFHTLNIEVFKAQHIVVVAQLVRQLKVRVTAFVGYSDVRPTDEFGRFLAVVRTMWFLVFARL